MDDDLKQLEAELQVLRPAAPSPAVIRRVGGALNERRLAGFARGWWLPAAAVVVLGLLSILNRHEHGPAGAASPVTATPADATLFKPVAAEKLLISALDEGIVTLADGTPARRERLQFVDTITWRNPRTNASLTWTVPREEVRVVPVVWQ